ncbi:MAG: IS110 family transposase [Gallionella sp.]|nr:IS110 family transposase [Gallionella sp.]
MVRNCIGLDIGKEFHWAVVIDEDERRLLSRRVENTEADISALLFEVEALGGERRWGCDMTNGPASLFLALALDKGEEVVYVPGITVKRERDSFPGESKTDARDAFVIAQAVRMRRNLTAFAANPELSAALKFLLSRYKDLIADQTRCVNRLRALLGEIFPALERAIGPTTRGALVLLTCYQTPLAIRRAGRNSIASILKEHGIRKADEIAKAASLAADQQKATLPGESIAAIIIADLARDILSLKERSTLLQKELSEHFFLHPQARIISSLPGYGPVLGTEFLVAVFDLKRFNNPDQLAAYGGVAPAARDSGKRAGNNKRAKKGNRSLKRVFCQSAFCSLRDPMSRRYYDRKKQEGKSGQQALIALARRRVNVLFAMLRDNREYMEVPTIPQQNTEAKIA